MTSHPPLLVVVTSGRGLHVHPKAARDGTSVSVVVFLFVFLSIRVTLENYAHG